MAGGAACLSNSNTRIIVCQIVTYVINVRQIVTYEFTVSSVVFCELLAEHVAICGCSWSAEITHVTF